MTAAVTGMGCVTGLAESPEAIWPALEAGLDAFRMIDRFDTGEPTLAALVRGARLGSPGELSIALATRAALQALEEAGIARGSGMLDDAALVLGTSAAESVSPIESIGEAVADAIGARGPRITVSTACAASTGALGLACDLIAAGDCRFVLAGGVEVLTPRIFAGFRALGVLAPGACAPFSEPPGITLGEGAGFVILEAADDAVRRGVRARAAVLGHGLSCDAFHETSPDPTGSGVARAILAALADAGVDREAIGYVNAHGTGTVDNDAAEWRGLQAVFGPHAARLPVSSSKSFLGHAQGAAGILEAIVTVLSLEQQAVPPTLHFRQPRPNGPADPVGQRTPRAWSFTHALSTSSAFGGANAAIVLGRRPVASRVSPRRPVWLAGLGAIGPHGTSVEELEAALGRGLPCVPPASPPSLARFAPRADPRGTDPGTCYLTAAVATALRDAGVAPEGARRDGIGLFVAVTRTSPQVERTIDETVARRGVLRLSASAFARSVLCAPAGYCAKVLGLRGATSTLSTGHGGGLHAIALGARTLARCSDLDAIVAGGLDEEPSTAEGDRGAAEGAACVVLSARPNLPPGAVRIVGIAIAPPGQGRQALKVALERAAVPPGELEGIYTDDPEVDGIDVGAVLGRPTASGSAFALVVAARACRRGGVVAVVTSSPRSSSCALVLRREDAP